MTIINHLNTAMTKRARKAFEDDKDDDNDNHNDDHNDNDKQ